MTDNEIRNLLAGATPGPWEWIGERADIGLYSSPQRGRRRNALVPRAGCIARMDAEGRYHPVGDPARANARLLAAAPALAAEVLRLRRALAVERGEEVSVPRGWVASRLGGWGRVLDGRHGRVTRLHGPGWSWSWTEALPRQDGFGPSGPAVVASGCAQTALEAMEAADAAPAGLGGDE